MSKASLGARSGWFDSSHLDSTLWNQRLHRAFLLQCGSNHAQLRKSPQRKRSCGRSVMAFLPWLCYNTCSKLGKKVYAVAIELSLIHI